MFYLMEFNNRDFIQKEYYVKINLGFNLQLFVLYYFIQGVTCVIYENHYISKESVALFNFVD